MNVTHSNHCIVYRPGKQNDPCSPGCRYLNGADSDPVNHPSHYTSGGIEVINAIEAWGLDRNYCLGNAVECIVRAGKKDPDKLKEDLMKARWYLDREISKL